MMLLYSKNDGLFRELMLDMNGIDVHLWQAAINDFVAVPIPNLTTSARSSLKPECDEFYTIFEIAHYIKYIIPEFDIALSYFI
uniref:Uncharacterized protein n=1 Tax=Glossina palpalis gambiensis TaxID=67801 RepID=A0A1B0BI85_9MUSC